MVLYFDEKVSYINDAGNRRRHILRVKENIH